uniref:Uncharacterized protein n=1 Tax=Oncorhynchus mykiss TaxID=8022 RepID=A0A8C7Q296_ONCMY
DPPPQVQLSLMVGFSFPPKHHHFTHRRVEARRAVGHVGHLQEMTPLQPLIQTVAEMPERKEAMDRASSPLLEMDRIPIPGPWT